MPGKVIIIGAGLAGSLLAVYLGRAGWDVTVFERRPDPRAKGYAGGRSINLALSVRGLWGLAGVGLDTVVMERDAIPMRGRMIHPVQGALAFQPYSKNPADAINSVSRGGLNLTLINAAAACERVAIHFDHACVDVDLDLPAAMIQGPDGQVRRVEADLVLGADGAFSPVRGRLQKTDRFEYSQSYLGHGYKELHIPAAAEGRVAENLPGARFALEPHALHIWPRGSSMMIALPNRDGSFTCTLFWPFDGQHSFQGLEGPLEERITAPTEADRGRVREFFAKQYPDAALLMPTLAEDFYHNPTSSLVTVRCRPWVWKDRVAILGDAAHAIVPFYGQGMNAAFEDVRILAESLAGTRDRGEALERFQALRKANCDAIADMAIENFLEMRDKVGQEEFRYKKRVEQAVHAMFEEVVTPQYNLVSFSTVPYAEARRRGQEFDRQLEWIIARVPRKAAEGMGEEAWRTAVQAAATEVLGGTQNGITQGAEAGPDVAGRGAGAASARVAVHGASALEGEGVVIDISPLLSARTAVFPGDTPLSREVLCDMAAGAHITVSTMRSTVHLGSHADGPNHYSHPAAAIHEMPLAHYMGKCQVIHVRGARGRRITPEDVHGAITCTRVLLRTDSQPDKSIFNPDFASLSPELVHMLADRGVVTVGIDTPSVDPADSKDLPAHAAFAARGVAIVEGLVLDGVDEGEYELIALPLKLEGFDASPVRAVLRRLE